MFSGVYVRTQRTVCEECYRMSRYNIVLSTVESMVVTGYEPYEKELKKIRSGIVTERGNDSHQQELFIQWLGMEK